MASSPDQAEDAGIAEALNRDARTHAASDSAHGKFRPSLT